MAATSRHGRVPSFPELRTERLRLRELTLADAPWYLAHFSRPEMVHGTGFPAPDGLGGAIAEMEQYVTGLFERRDGLRWALVLAETGEVVGTAGLFRWNDGAGGSEASAELGYDLAPERWGGGLMTEAIAVIVAYGFETMGLARIDALVLADNARSCRTLERAGFQHDALLPAHGETEDGLPCDEHRYVLRQGGTTRG